MVGRAIPARLRRHAWAAGLAAALLLMPAQPHRIAAAQDLQQEKPVIAAIEIAAGEWGVGSRPEGAGQFAAFVHIARERA